MKYSFLFFATLFLMACSSNMQKDSISNKSANIKYAKGLSIDSLEQFVRVTLSNPWDNKGKILSRYYLIKKTDNLTDSIPEDGIVIQIPLQKVAVSSGTHIGFIDAFNQLDIIKGICYPDRIFNDTIRARYERHELQDLGDPFLINMESLISLNPEAIIASGYSEQDEYSKRMKRSGVPVIFINEWMEPSPLGRAEWIKFISLLLDNEAEGQAKFNEIERAYLRLSSLTAKAEKKPAILTGENFRGTWYMPGGNNWMAQIFRDAGADYYYDLNPSAGSIPLSTEEVMSKFYRAPYWFNVNAENMDELIATDSKHSFFEAYKAKQIFNNNAQTNGLANQYWEKGVIEPHVILRDYIKILHPELNIKDPLVYLKQLN
ncbi:MAG: ABC transporter substrate-binding protein [Bacteroidales bacterium]